MTKTETETKTKKKTKATNKGKMLRHIKLSNIDKCVEHL